MQHELECEISRECTVRAAVLGRFRRGASARGSVGPKVERCKDKFDAQTLGKALFGLQSLTDTDEARKLVVALTPKVKHCEEKMDANTVRQALVGLRRFGDSYKFRQLAVVLLPKIDECLKGLSEKKLSDELDYIDATIESLVAEEKLDQLFSLLQVQREDVENWIRTEKKNLLDRLPQLLSQQKPKIVA